MDLLSPGDAAAGRLLIVDDDAINRAILENIFAPFYAIDERRTATRALPGYWRGRSPSAPCFWTWSCRA